ncbi:MAG: glycosyltransferase [Bacteroidales bacterium]|nr:glycosyltransferase [Bacteroidales bacterium]
MKEYGVEPIVVTRQWSNKYGNELDYIAPGESKATIVEATDYGTIIRTPYKPNLANRIMLKYGRSKFALIRKMVTAWYEFWQFLFFVGPKSELYRGAKEYLKHNKVDAIIATGEPFVLFKYASALSKKYGIPWVADYRDPWIQNKNCNHFMKIWNAYFEKKYAGNMKCVVTVSDFCRIQIATNVCKPFHIIPNGYNPDAIYSVSHIGQMSDKMSIALAGKIYNWHPYISVLSVFDSFISANNDIKAELNFYGINRVEEITNYIRKKNLEQYIHLYSQMDNESLLQILRGNNIMLLFNDYSIMGTKIYDYLGLHRQILLCYANDKEALILKNKFYPNEEINGLGTHLQEDLIKQTNSGIVVKNQEHLLQVLNDLYAEFNQNHCIACHSVHTEQFSRKEGVRQLAEMLQQNCFEHTCYV